MFTAPKGFYASLICLTAFCFSALPAFAQDALPTPPQEIAEPEKKDDGKSMKSLRWNTQKKKEEPATEPTDAADASKKDAQETSEDDKTAKTEGAEIPEEEMTAEQKMWKKYKELAEKGKDKKKKSKEETYSESAESENNLTEEALSEEDAKKAEEQATGMQAILERYKNAQKDKGVMNSRSFGSAK